MIHVDPESQDPYDKTYQNSQWSGELNQVKSTLGYKLETNNSGLCVLPMSGTILPPETTLPLFGFHQNWTGYFLTATQSPFDAIATEFLDKITWMAGHYWYCHKEDNPGLKNSGYWWRCACEKGRIEIKYGEMIVIFPSENIEGFHWQYADQSLQDEPKGPSLFFEYEEKAEYTPIFIELDTLNLPLEIGAFAGDSCIGATTVLPSDTMVLICAYTEGFEGEEITFELLDPTKSVHPRYKEYLVLNSQSGIREHRRITAGEKQPYFVVSLTNDTEQNSSSESSWLQCMPNPAHQEVKVSYFLDREAEVSLQLTDAIGRMVLTWQRGKQGAGKYDFSFSTGNLPAEYYQLMLSAGSYTGIQKVLIIH